MLPTPNSSFITLLFVLTYIGIALGEIPGLMIDRVGIAVLGATAMVVFGGVSVSEVHRAVDLPTLLLLYSLMIVSAQLRLGGFYTRTALRITHLSTRPLLLLALIMSVSAFLSALLANDIICLAFTPVLVYSLAETRLNPVPFLLGLAAASNIGSAATIIGNPQNMLIGQVGRLDFAQFVLWCTPPALVSLAGAYGIIALAFRRRMILTQPLPFSETQTRWPEFNAWQSAKGILAVTVLVILFFSPLPRELSAIAVSGILLLSRKLESREIMALVDWNLLVLFLSLFIVIHGITEAGLPSYLADELQRRGADLRNPYLLSGVSTLLSNLVSNVPAVMLLVKFLDPHQPIQWYALAVSSTFAGNLITIGSIANLIVFEQAKPFGVTITFREHAKIGVPVTLFSLLVLFLWLAVTT
ncbi:MAG: SLC13 family permease [candidate division KSB1 bacterium]|nr:SLC13 family permease [candidate division KSB1 bacterium]